MLRNKAGKFVAPTMEASRRRGECRLVEGAELRHRPERPAGRQQLADRVGHLRPAADRSEGRAQSAARQEVLRLGLRERRRDREAAAIHPAARQRCRMRSVPPGRTCRARCNAWHELDGPGACRDRHDASPDHPRAASSVASPTPPIARQASGASATQSSPAWPRPAGIFVLLLLAPSSCRCSSAGCRPSARSASASSLGRLGPGEGGLRRRACRSTAPW